MSWTAVAVAGLAALIAVGVHQPWCRSSPAPRMGLFTNGGDLDVYRHGALQVLHGQPLYAVKLPPGGWFTYPPFAAMSFLPLALLNSAVAKALCCWCRSSRSSRRSGGAPPPWAGGPNCACSCSVWRWRSWRSTSRPFGGTLWQGQVNLVLMAIVTWDLTRANDSRLRGCQSAWQLGVKLTAVVFIPPT